MNIICARNVIKSEVIDTEKYVGKLDEWAAIAKRMEQKYLPSLLAPARYLSSYAVPFFSRARLGCRLDRYVSLPNCLPFTSVKTHSSLFILHSSFFISTSLLRLLLTTYGLFRYNIS